MVSPCPCMSLQRGVTILATIEAVLAVIYCIFTALALIIIAAVDPDDIKDVDVTQTEKNIAMVFLVIVLIIFVLDLVLALFLRKAALSNHYQNLKKWLIIAIVLFIIGTVTVSVSYSTKPTAWQIVTTVLGKLYNLYVMFVVWSLMKEIDNAGMSNYYSHNSASTNGP